MVTGEEALKIAPPLNPAVEFPESVLWLIVTEPATV
jgi:hypothetical protein